MPSQIKHIEARLDIVEKIIGNAEPVSLYHKLENFNSMLKFFEKTLNRVEPDIERNKKNIIIINKKLRDLQAEVTGKINSEHFDSIKALVIALASGISRSELPNVEFLSSKEENYLENLENRLAKLEGFNFEEKDATTNFDDLYFKLHRVEQKLDFKVEVTELEKIRLSLSQISEQNKHLSSEMDVKEKKYNLSNLKPSDSSILTSINRKFLTYEEIIKSLQLPYGVTLISMWEEIQKLWDAVKFTLNSLEAYGNQYDSKINEIIEKFSNNSVEKLIKRSENDLREHIKMVNDIFEKRFADKFEMLRGFKYVENELNRLEKLSTRNLGEEAMLARKPLGGWSCGSCEKNLESLASKPSYYTSWNKLPVRDPKERIQKAGPGYSKMLCTMPLEPLKKKMSSHDDMNLPTVIHTDRSVTPQPGF